MKYKAFFYGLHDHYHYKPPYVGDQNDVRVAGLKVTIKIIKSDREIAKERMKLGFNKVLNYYF